MWFVLLGGLLSACARVEATRQSIHVHMSSVDLHVADDVTLHVHELHGQFVPLGRSIPILDDKRSYTVQVDSGEVAVDEATLNALMARTLGNNHSNVERLQVAIEPDGTLRQRGRIDAAIDLPFQSKGQVSVTADGRLRVSTRSMKGFGIPVKPVLSFFGVKLDDLVKVEPGHGIVVDGNDLIVDLAKVLPAPGFSGRLSAVRVENGRLVQVFGNPSPRASGRSSRPHIYWRGGQLSFGKLTMSETDLELIDQDPSDPFDFSVEHWQTQLVAGYSKTLRNRGLRAFMPDYDDITQARYGRARR
jgi:hypothetical protein